MPQPPDDPAPLVIGLPRGHEMRPRRGECLLDAARRADVPLASSCGGRGVCGDCVVRIVGGAADLAPPGDVERAWSHVRSAPPACASRAVCTYAARPRSPPRTGNSAAPVW